MANVIRIKRRAVGGSVGAPAALKSAELAYNMADDTIYIGYGDDGSGNATSIKAVGGEGAYAKLASPAFTGVPTGPTAAVDTNTTQLATTAFVLAQAGSATPLIAGTAAVGTSTRFARQDHVHPNQRIDQLLAPTASVSFNSQKITSLADPTAATDAATKQYVDNVAQGLDAKQSVRAATTANITLSGAQTIDGVAVIAGDRVLVKNQTAPAENGLYVAAAGSWSRASDMDSWAEVPSAFVFVEEGSTNADTSWVVSSNAGGTLGTTAIAWFQFGSASAYTAGNGLQLSGNSFSVLANGTTINVSASGIKVSDTYAGNASLSTLGTVTTGSWAASIIAVSYGGTGVNTLTGLVKGNGTSAFSAAVAGTDYHDTSSTIDCGTF